MDWNDAWDAAGEALKNDQETIFEMSMRLAEAEAETKRLRKIEYAANAAYNCWAGEGKASSQLMEALRKALGGE